MLQRNNVLNKVMDCLDFEAFFVCENESEGKSLMLSLLSQMGFPSGDVVFIQQEGFGARVRGRAYLRSIDSLPPYFHSKGDEQ